MITKSILIGVFIKKNIILCFLEMLKQEYKIPYDKIFIFQIENNEKEYLVTFKTNDKEKFLTAIHDSTVMHVKNSCLFSINALNKLIEKENGSIDKNYQIDWNLYKDKLIILTNGNLTIKEINKVENKCLFFK